ncbi:MAG: ATP-dependent helicase, partial [Sphingomonadales bacterium]|nr:ATP-dependent helicase [Sphingomonadales bacterium]
GKTRVLTHRIAHLVAGCAAPAEACLAITFTRRAAREMGERLAKLLPGDWRKIPIHTFHSLALALLRENPEAAGLEAGFRIAGEAERAALIHEKLDISEARARRLLGAISRAKRTGQAGNGETAEALRRYEAALAARNWLDFDDLVSRALAMLQAHPDLLRRTRERFRWISADEFQDADAQQYALLKLLAGEDGNLCVIGDANQAIYGFRGADASVMARFRKDYPSAAAISLWRNYRSSGTIVAASAQVMGAGGIAEAVRDMAAEIEIHSARTERAEAEFVVHTIEQLLGGHSFFSIDSGRTAAAKEAELGFSDIAVLYRTEAQAEPLLEAFARSGMPVQKQANRPLTAHAGVAALVEALEEGRDTPLRDRLKTAVSTLATDGPEQSAELEMAWRHLDEMAEAAGGDEVRFMEAVTLASEADLWDPRADRISLMTLHAAKGLEFPVVFIVGAEEGILPLTWGTPDEAALAEERRLFYVGMTRAEDRLFLSWAEKRLWRGKVREQSPSPYLAAIEAALTEKTRMKARTLKPADRQLSLFS